MKLLGKNANRSKQGKFKIILNFLYDKWLHPKSKVRIRIHNMDNQMLQQKCIFITKFVIKMQGKKIDITVLEIQKILNL